MSASKYPNAVNLMESSRVPQTVTARMKGQIDERLIARLIVTRGTVSLRGADCEGHRNTFG
jgi:hypothetical protein